MGLSQTEKASDETITYKKGFWLDHQFTKGLWWNYRRQKSLLIRLLQTDKILNRTIAEGKDLCYQREAAFDKNTNDWKGLWSDSRKQKCFLNVRLDYHRTKGLLIIRPQTESAFDKSILKNRTLSRKKRTLIKLWQIERTSDQNIKHGKIF